MSVPGPVPGGSRSPAGCPPGGARLGGDAGPGYGAGVATGLRVRPMSPAAPRGGVAVGGTLAVAGAWLTHALAYRIVEPAAPLGGHHWSATVGLVAAPAVVGALARAARGRAPRPVPLTAATAVVFLLTEAVEAAVVGGHGPGRATTLVGLSLVAPVVAWVRAVVGATRRILGSRPRPRPRRRRRDRPVAPPVPPLPAVLWATRPPGRAPPRPVS